MATDRDLLRHGLAVLAYRAAKPLRDPPPGFAAYSTGPGAWTPLHLVTHLADLIAWANTAVRGKAKYQDSTPATWEHESARFFAQLAELDAYVASDQPLASTCERLLAGPLADALTHTGQLAMLRRMAGAPIVAESYFRADIVAGAVGPEQPPPVYSFTRPPV
jgi:hypothetical protein